MPYRENANPPQGLSTQNPEITGLPEVDCKTFPVYKTLKHLNTIPRYPVAQPTVPIARMPRYDRKSRNDISFDSGNYSEYECYKSTGRCVRIMRNIKDLYKDDHSRWYDENASTVLTRPSAEFVT